MSKIILYSYIPFKTWEKTGGPKSTLLPTQIACSETGEKFGTPCAGFFKGTWLKFCGWPTTGSFHSMHPFMSQSHSFGTWNQTTNINQFQFADAVGGPDGSWASKKQVSRTLRLIRCVHRNLGHFSLVSKCSCLLQWSSKPPVKYAHFPGDLSTTSGSSMLILNSAPVNSPI